MIPKGSISETPVTSVDIFPTFLEMAGVELPRDREIDGVSLLSHLKTGGEADFGRNKLIWHFPHYRHDPGPYSIIREGDWKLIKFWEGPTELYNLRSDLSEEYNLAASNGEKVESLEVSLIKILDKTEAKVPIFNPEYKEPK
jgi:arylsulfatase A-like enzyme